MNFIKYLILTLGFHISIWSMEIDHYKNVIFKESELDTPLFYKGKLSPIQQLANVLIKYKTALECLRDALLQFNTQLTHKSLISFDPHVGDTCCEMRAFGLASYLIENIYQETCLNDVWMSSFLKKINAVISKILELEVKLKERGTFAHFKQGATYRTFFDHNKLSLNIEIPDEIRYLQLCYFLTQARKKGYSFDQELFTEKFLKLTHIKKGAFGLTSKIFKDIVRCTQAELSKASVKQIQKELDNLSILSEEFKEDLHCAIGAEGSCLSQGIDGKEVAAYFPMLVVLYASALQRNIPIVLKVLKFSKDPKGFTRICKLYLPDKDNFMFKAVDIDDTDIDKDSVAIVIEALSFDGPYSEFEEFLKTQSPIQLLSNPVEDLSFELLYKKLQVIDLLHILWADASMHPQFAHKKDKNIELENIVFSNFCNKPHSLLGPLMKIYQGDAKKIGCCHNNMSLMYLKHIYVDFIEKALS